MLNVQFSDSTDTKIIAYFGAPQDPAFWPNQGAVETSDARWATYYNGNVSLQPYLPAPTGSTI